MNETDDELRARIINTYGKWGAFCSLVLEADGVGLDELAEHIKLTPRGRTSNREGLDQ